MSFDNYYEKIRLKKAPATSIVLVCAALATVYLIFIGFNFKVVIGSADYKEGRLYFTPKSRTLSRIIATAVGSEVIDEKNDAHCISPKKTMGERFITGAPFLFEICENETDELLEEHEVYKIRVTINTGRWLRTSLVKL